MKQLQLASLKWKDLVISPKELRLDTLQCGQSFRWKQIKDNHWASVLQGKLIVLKETPSTVFFGYETDHHQQETTIHLLKDYFQLEKVSLEDCYQRWSKIDSNFAKRAIHFQGIRMLRQDPWENLISFICSSNNNIVRISQMIDKLCTRFGTKIAELDQVSFYDFPTLDALLVKDMDIEKILRELGFGYRAKYIANTAYKIKSEHQSEQWLKKLRDVPYKEAKEVLIELQGVGPKVADCVCLMSLDHSESIPVDTHVWQIALRDYGFHKKGKSLTSKLYIEVGDHFRLLFGDYSGWAHSVLFTADLKRFEMKKEKEDNKRKIEQVLVVEELKIEQRETKKIKTPSTCQKVEEMVIIKTEQA